MCGIAGIWGEGVRPGDAHVLGDALHHRGPDEQTQYDREGFSLNFNRLAIIDTSYQAGHPQTQGWWTVWLNGCIYNYQELRTKLEGCGYTFSTKGDTEVVAALIDKAGIDKAVRMLNGMFVIVAWNHSSRDLYIIRDRYGIKPLYWMEIDGKIVFASEIKALLRYPGFTVRVNRNALGQWMTYQNIHTDETLFEGIQKMDKGTVWHVNGHTSYRYWNWQFTSETMNYKDVIAEVRRLLQQAVTRQLQADVPVAAFCSGGVDSSAVAAFSKAMTFTCGYSEQEYDERKYAEAVAIANRLPSCSILIGPDAIRKNLEQTIWHQEDLRVGPGYSNYMLHGLTSRFAKVCLQGTGADELFGGYEWRHSAVDYYSIVDRTKMNLLAYPFEPATYYTSPQNWADRYVHDAEHFLEGVLLVGDRMSSAWGVEDRVPFLDNDLVDFATRIPPEFKIKKQVLKDALYGILPPEILYRKKKGFTSPEAVWLFKENRSWAEDMIRQTPDIEDYLNLARVGEAFSTGNTAAVWCSLAFSQWMRIFCK